jgi:hypothetical protein
MRELIPNAPAEGPENAAALVNIINSVWKEN